MYQKTDFKIPLIAKLLFPFMLGVIIAFYCPQFINSQGLWLNWFVLFALTLPVVSRLWRLKHLFGIFTSVFFLWLGIFLVGIQTTQFNENYFTKYDNIEQPLYQFKLLESPEEKTNSIKCLAEVRGVDQQKAIGEVLLYFEKTERAMALSYGDLLLSNSQFKPVKTNGNPKEFDYTRYLRIHGVTHQGYVKDSGWLKVGEDANPIFETIYEIRNVFKDLLTNSGLDGANLMVAKALILGEKESLDRETLRTYSSAGAMHVLAVSGLHVGIVMLLFSFLLAPVKRLPKGKFLFVFSLLLVIWFYALITGLSSSVLRASVMFSFVIVGKELERDVSIYQSIMVSAFLLILFNPLIIFQVGFQLSYLAVLGIVALQPKIYNLFYVRFFLLDKMWQITSVSIAAQLATFPLGLYYFHQFPNFFMLSNLIVIPLAFAILLLGIAYFVLCWIPYVEPAVFFFLDLTLTTLNKGVKWIEQLPYSIYWGVSIHWFEVFLLYLIILLAAIAFARKKAKFLLASLSLVVLLLIFNIAEKWQLDSRQEIVFYNVKGELAIDFFDGRQNAFISSNQLFNDEDKLLFHVKHNWFYHTGQEEPTNFYPYNGENVVLEFQGKRLWLASNLTVKAYPKVALVYLHNCKYVPPNYAEYLVKTETILIFGDNLSYQLKNYLSKVKGLVTHDLSKKGAFVFPVY